MAQIETWFDQDIEKPVAVHHLKGDVFNADNAGNLVGVRVFKDGEPFTLSGSVVGYCVLASGLSVPVPGTLSNNKAYIVLPEVAYSVPGILNIIIKLTSGTSITTLAAVVTSVVGLGGVIEDPSQATIDAWTAQINATLTTLLNTAVLYSQAQSLNAEQKTRARNNIGASTTAVLISGEDYRIVAP